MEEHRYRLCSLYQHLPQSNECWTLFIIKLLWASGFEYDRQIGSIDFNNFSENIKLLYLNHLNKN